MSKVEHPYLPPFEDVTEALRRLPPSSLVGIDGRSAAGKTHLARRLSLALGWPAYHLDDTLLGNRTGHRADVASLTVASLRDQGLTVLAEGVRLLETFSRAEISFLIYVKFRPHPTANGWFHRSIEEYLSQHRPWEQADFCIEAQF